MNDVSRNAEYEHEHEHERRTLAVGLPE